MLGDPIPSAQGGGIRTRRPMVSIVPTESEPSPGRPPWELTARLRVTRGATRTCRQNPSPQPPLAIVSDRLIVAACRFPHGERGSSPIVPVKSTPNEKHGIIHVEIQPS